MLAYTARPLRLIGITQTFPGELVFRLYLGSCLIRRNGFIKLLLLLKSTSKEDVSSSVVSGVDIDLE